MMVLFLLHRALLAREFGTSYPRIASGVMEYILIANYLAPYVIFALWLPIPYLIVRLEGRELRDRFRQAYAEYCRVKGGMSVQSLSYFSNA
jgi:hypothetical protein